LSYICQHDPRWFPEPEKFDPDRFLPERQRNLPPFAYFPFGGGPRGCIGNTFAMMAMTLVAATLLQQLKLELAAAQGEAQPVALKCVRPKGEVRVRWTRRDTGGQRGTSVSHTPKQLSLRHRQPGAGHAPTGLKSAPGGVLPWVSWTRGEARSSSAFRNSVASA